MHFAMVTKTLESSESLLFIFTFSLLVAAIPYGLLAHVGSASVDIEGGMASGNRNRRQRFFQLQDKKKRRSRSERSSCREFGIPWGFFKV